MYVAKVDFRHPNAAKELIDKTHQLYNALNRLSLSLLDWIEHKQPVLVQDRSLNFICPLMH